MKQLRGGVLELISIEVPSNYLPVWEKVIAGVCVAVGLFPLEETGRWRIEGIRSAGQGEQSLAGFLAVAQFATGQSVTLARRPIPADGWLARTQAAFPEQQIERFVIRGSHLRAQFRPACITLTIDAGAAFGSGEHPSTRGCLRALVRVAHRSPRGVLDLGTGSGILAMAAARLLNRSVLATDLDPWSLRVADANLRLNRLFHLVKTTRSDGWRHRTVRNNRPYGLVFANILARPLCAMAPALSAGLAPGGTAILSGLLRRQARQVSVAHRRVGLRLEAWLLEGDWATLILRKPN